MPMGGGDGVEITWTTTDICRLGENGCSKSRPGGRECDSCIYHDVLRHGTGSDGNSYVPDGLGPSRMVRGDGG